jgi:hypothetical protein
VGRTGDSEFVGIVILRSAPAEGLAMRADASARVSSTSMVISLINWLKVSFALGE